MRYGRATFQPYMANGGFRYVLSWICLVSIYYVVARACIDILTDAVDRFHGPLALEGGLTEADRRMSKPPPYDFLELPAERRKYSPWQAFLYLWLRLEIIIAWIAFIGMMYTYFASPFLNDVGPNFLWGVNKCDGWLCTAKLFFIGADYILVICAASSLVSRLDVGISPLPMRWAGLENWYAGQNIAPRWLNELFIRFFGRPC